MKKDRYRNKPRAIQFSHDMVYMAVKPQEHRKDTSQPVFMTHVHGTMPGFIEPGEILPPYLIGSDIEKQIAEAIRPIVKQLVDDGMNSLVIPSTLANAAFMELLNNGTLRLPQDIPVVEIPARTGRNSSYLP